MSFDYDRAWRDTTRLLRENRPMLAAIAGIFFFLPYAAFLMALPSLAPLPPEGADFGAVMRTMSQVYEHAWWAILLLSVALVYGTLAMLALLKLRARPTVAEALRLALGALPFYCAAAVIEMIAINTVLFLFNGVAALTGSAAVAWATALLSLYLQLYFVMRFAMAAPVIVIEGERNPVAALRRSWLMTRGIGGRLCGFCALLLLAFVVVTLVVSLFVGAVLALLGDAAAELGQAMLSAAIMASAFMLMACVLAAIYSQLARRGARSEP